jgi:hypothetical protein
MAVVINNAAKYIQTPDKSLNGQETFCFQAVLSGEALVFFIKQFNLLDILSPADKPDLNPEAFDLSTFAAGYGSQSITFWLDKKTFLPVKYYANLTPLTNKLMESYLSHSANTASESADTPYTVEHLEIGVTYREAEMFALPPEIL